MTRAARLVAWLPLLAAASAVAGEPAPSTAVWKARGTPAMQEALARAKAAKRRVLVALPGGDGCCGDVPVDKGPIAKDLEKEPFLSFAAGCETVLVEPPEGAIVGRAYGVNRPGLLLVDGDGRWLGAVTMAKTGGADLAKTVTQSLGAAPAAVPEATLLVVGAEGAAATFAASLRGASGVEKVVLGKESRVVVTGAALSYATLAAVAPPAGATVTWLSPLRIVVSGGPGGAPSEAAVAALASRPGVLEVAREGGALVAYGPKESIDPAAVTAAVAAGGSTPTSSHVVRRWRLAGLEKTMAGLAMLEAPLAVRGVLSVRPDRPNRVVALLVDATFDEPALDAAWKAAYAEATPLP